MRLFTCLLLFALPFGHAAAEEAVLFEHYFADRDLRGSQWAMLVIADLDGDGKEDIVVAPSKWSKVSPHYPRWYRNTGDPADWVGPLTIPHVIVSDCGIAAVDINGNGRVDLIFSAMWLENIGSAEGRPEFKKHIFDPQLHSRRKKRGRATYGAHDIVTVDLDGDGRIEVVTHGDVKNNDALFVYKLPADPKNRWDRHRIAQPGQVHAAIAPAGIGDVSGDGRPDIVYVDSWSENTGEWDRWKERRNFQFGKSGPWGIGVRCVVADIDGDGANDIVQSGCDVPAAAIVCFLNHQGDGSKWKRVELPMSIPPGDFHSLAVQDFDQDGDLDIYADEMEHIHVAQREGPKFRQLVWLNQDGKGLSWKERTITAGLGGHEAQSADLDGDGDFDIVTKCFTAGANRNGGRLHISVLENLSVK